MDINFIYLRFINDDDYTIEVYFVKILPANTVVSQEDIHIFIGSVFELTRRYIHLGIIEAKEKAKEKIKNYSKATNDRIVFKTSTGIFITRYIYEIEELNNIKL